MVGARPKIYCAQCNAELKWNATSCPSCGVEIDWPGMSLPSSEKSKRRDGRHREEASRAWPSKAIAGAIVVAAIAVIVYEGVNGSRSNSGAGGSLSSGEVRANDAQAAKDMQVLEQNVAAHPEDASLTLQLANALQDHSMFEKAVHYYSVYLTKNPTNADARVDMGICYKELNDLVEAEKQMKQALNVVPGHVNATFNLGIVCRDEGKIQESNEWFQKAAALDPNGEVGKRAKQLLAEHNSQIPKIQ